MQQFEGHFIGVENAELYYQTWSNESPSGTIVITHGLAEHSDCYKNLAKVLAENNWYVVAWDLRGHGRSEGQRGYVKNFNHYQNDLELLVHHLRQSPDAPKEPMILFGHSMGGLITLLQTLKTTQAQPDAVVLSSPALGLSMEVPKAKEFVAHIAEKWFPTLTLHNGIKYSDLSRDQAVVDSYEKDNLRHDKVSPGIFLGMQRSIDFVFQNVAAIKVPILMQLSGDDRLVSAPASRDLFSRLTNKKNQLHIYPDSYHEIYNDLDRENVIADLKKFLGTFKRAA